MNNYPHPIIAREGWPFLGLAVVVAALVTYFSAVWSIPLWIIALFVLQFFRDPARTIPQQPNAVLSERGGYFSTLSDPSAVEARKASDA